jgi:hypothetical protein
MGLMAGHMTDRITTIEEVAGAQPDIEGNKPTTTTTNVPALVEFRQRLIRTATGETKPSRATLCTERKVTAGTLIILPGETTPQAVLEMSIIRGLGGVEDHREVYL